MLYIIHFTSAIGDLSNPKGHASHYTGCCADDRLQDRLLEHRSGYGAKITQAAVRRGIALLLGATLPGGYIEEKILKQSTKNAPRYCAICREQRILEKMFQSERGRHDATA